VVNRFANGVIVLQKTCPGLVGQIEQGDLESPSTRAILEEALKPMLKQGVDRVVIGCTHYPFVIPLIQEIVGSKADVIDPAPAVARQTERVLRDRKLLNTRDSPGKVHYLTTGNPGSLMLLLPKLVGERSDVRTVKWHEGRLSDPQEML
jgi:glutamate racemase